MGAMIWLSVLFFIISALDYFIFDKPLGLTDYIGFGAFISVIYLYIKNPPDELDKRHRKIRF